MRALPIGFFVAASLALVAGVVRTALAPEEMRVALVTETLAASITPALFLVGLGFAYQAALRGAGAATTIFGWVHLVLAVLGQLLMMAAGLARDTALTGGDFDVQRLALLYGVAGAAALFSGLFFVAAMATAFAASPPAEPADAAFD